MDKKSIRINFNFNIAKNKNGRNNSHFISRVCKNNSKVSIPRYLCKKYCFMYENDFNRTFNE